MSIETELHNMACDIIDRTTEAQLQYLELAAPWYLLCVSGWGMMP